MLSGIHTDSEGSARSSVKAPNYELKRYPTAKCTLYRSLLLLLSLFDRLKVQIQKTHNIQTNTKITYIHIHIYIYIHTHTYTHIYIYIYIYAKIIVRLI